MLTLFPVGVKMMFSGRGSNMETGSRLATLSLLLSAVFSPCVCIPGPNEINPLLYEEHLLWVSGTQGEVNTYRIPLLTSTHKGTLLAFAEARKAFQADTGSKFLAMRRSTDKGAIWSPIKYIVDDDQMQDGLNLGSVVVDHEVGSIFLIYSVCFHVCNPSSTMMVESTDDGLSWSQPRNLSAEFQLKNFAPGPGLGLQKRYNPAKGRLVVCGHGTLEGDGVFCILSDDHGRSWTNGAVLKSIPYNRKKKPQDFNPDECQPFEMLDGSIVINVRNQNNYHCRCRIVMRSLDGGLTLPIDELYFDYELVDPAVAAGALQKEGVLFFTNPANDQHRINLTLRWSLTNGTSWEKNAVQIWGGPSGYSCITTLDTGSPEDRRYIYVIYEKGHKDYDETISFAKIHLYGGN
ncbi:sialidase-1 [Thunnus albacares]|uniref:sialidase-1 n=1 Tax=Thunnus albacares TaxID=8236 RepID=UPI001CF66815|nr:sialidase-1 [Thunnus albacares]XP_044192435.1 sialidase-1 [Thunnus albacares]